MKKIIAGFAAAAALLAGVCAADFGPQPADYETTAEAYITARLTDPRAAKFQFTSAPYMVYADIAGYEGLPCWAVDVRVKSRLPTGSIGGYVPYTVIFLDGEAVALQDDARRIARI